MRLADPNQPDLASTQDWQQGLDLDSPWSPSAPDRGSAACPTPHLCHHPARQAYLPRFSAAPLVQGCETVSDEGLGSLTRLVQLENLNLSYSCWDVSSEVAPACPAIPFTYWLCPNSGADSLLTVSSGPLLPLNHDTAHSPQPLRLLCGVGTRPSVAPLPSPSSP